MAQHGSDSPLLHFSPHSPQLHYHFSRLTCLHMKSESPLVTGRQVEEPLCITSFADSAADGITLYTTSWVKGPQVAGLVLANIGPIPHSAIVYVPPGAMLQPVKSSRRIPSSLHPL